MYQWKYVTNSFIERSKLFYCKLQIARLYGNQVYSILMLNIVYNVKKIKCLIPVLLYPPLPAPLPLPPPSPTPQVYIQYMMAENNDFIDALNDNAELDFFTGYNRDYYDDEVNDDPYFGTQCVSKFYDVLSLSSEEFIRMSPIFLSLNIQSLQSKYEQ